MHRSGNVLNKGSSGTAVPSRSVRLYIASLYVACFPYFGLNLVDHAGLEALEGAGLTNALHVFVVMLSSCLLAVLRLKKDIRCVNVKKINGALRGVFFGVTVFLVGMLISILVNSPNYLVSWFRFVQLAASAMLAYYAVKRIYAVVGDQVYVEFFKIIINTFVVVLVCIFLAYFIEPQLAFGHTSDRGLRLGGAFIHPNTLGLGAICFAVAAITLFGAKRIAGAVCFSCLAISVSVIYLTASLSSAIVILAVMLLKTGEKLPKIITILGLGVVLVVGFYFLTSANVDIYGVESDRIRIWGVAFQGIRDNWIFGVAPYSGVKNYFENSGVFDYFIPPHAHNLILDAFLAGGILFPVPLLALLMWVCIRVVRSVLGRPDVWELGFGLIVFAVTLHGMVESSFSSQVKAFCHGLLVSSLCLYSIRRARIGG